MATKTFGTPVKTAEEYLQELYKLAGVEFPIEITLSNGKIVAASYETTWKDGGTTPVEKLDKKTNETTIEYEEHYTNKKLTAAQIKKVDAWLKENIAE